MRIPSPVNPRRRNRLAAAALFLAAVTAAAAEEVRETYCDFDGPEAAQEWSYYWGRGGGASLGYADSPAPEGGKGAGLLRYAFSQAGDYFVMRCTRPLPEGVRSIRFQLFGDRSGQPFSCRVIDRTGESFLYPVAAAVDWAGWKEFDLAVAAPANVWGGDGNKVIDPPARLAFEMKAAQAGSGVLSVARITTVSMLAESNQVAIKLKSAPSGNLFFAGQAAPVMQAEFRNRGSTPKTLDLVFRLADQDGMVLQKTARSVPVPAQAAPVTVDLPLDLRGRFGSYRLTADVMAGETVVRRETASLGLVAPQTSTPPGNSPFGLNLALAQRYAPGDMAPAAALARSLGMKWSREEISWEAVEPVKGTYQWEKIDRAVELAAANRQEILGLLGYCATWARRDPAAHASPPRDVEDYARFVGQTVSRYKGKIRYWEIWNEPDSAVFWPPKPDVREYAALLKAAYQAAKRADPDCRVMTAGLLVGINHSGNWTFLEDLYKNGGGGAFDILALHAYCDPRSPEDGGYAEKLKKLREIMTRNGDGTKPLWLTEEGWPTAPGKKNYVNEKLQAEYLVRAHAHALATPGLETFFWFLMTDGGNWESDYEQSYGILRSDWTPKPAGIAYATMTRLLGGATFAETISMKGSVRCQVFRSGPGVVLVMWNGRPETVKVQAAVARDSLSGISDLYGNALSAVAGNRLELTLSGSPVYVTLRAEALADLRAALAAAEITVTPPVEPEPAETRVLEDFEDIGWGRTWKLGWPGSGHEGSALSSSREQAHGGNASGKLAYQADPAKGKYGLCYVEIDRPLPLPDETRRIGLWVYGDNSGHQLSLRLQDFNHETFQYTLAKAVDWTGWRHLEVRVGKPDSSFGGDKNGVLDYPLTFQGVILGAIPSRKMEGTVYLDDLTIRY